MDDPVPNPELLRSLGHLARGLSALFWGLPLTLVVCVQTAKGDWLDRLGVMPPVGVNALLVYGLSLLLAFRPQERLWINSVERARILGVVNLGLSPFLFWWSHVPGVPLYQAMSHLLMLSGLAFLFALNVTLLRLALLVPDESLRLETRLFTKMNRLILATTFLLILSYLGLGRLPTPPPELSRWVTVVEHGGLWILMFLILLPMAMTMALLWKTKEVIHSSVFGA